MSMLMLLIGVVALFYLFKTIHSGKRMNRENKDYIQWGLCVDCCVFYSRPFTVVNQFITIRGFQKIVDNKSTIYYSLVKMNRWGKRKVYGQGMICGNYTDSNSFQITMEDIPNGEGYQIEIFNGFKLSYGQFQIKLDPAATGQSL